MPPTTARGGACGWSAIDLTDGDLLRIEQLADQDRARATVERLPAEQRDAITAHIVGERSYADIAASLSTSEVVVRKRVSRGLATVRKFIGERE